MKNRTYHPISDYRMVKLNRATVREFAETLGDISASAISAYEAGYNIPPPDTISKMAEVFGVDQVQFALDIQKWHSENKHLLRAGSRSEKVAEKQ